MLQRGDLKHAHYYRAKLCENIPALIEDDVALRNLMDAIRKYAIEQRDPEARKGLLPILRVLTTPEATQLIEEEFYRTTDESERLVLLEAMSNPGHNPATAGVWAADIAINSEDREHRLIAFEYIAALPIAHHEVVVKTAKQVYAASTRPEQRVEVIHAISRRADDTAEGRKFLRERMADPKELEIAIVTEGIEGWGTQRDAVVLEALAAQFPALQDILRGRADRIRTQDRIRDDPDRAAAVLAEEEARERERRKQEEANKNENE